MNESKTFTLRGFGQALKEFDVHRIQLFSRPTASDLGIGIEAGDIDFANGAPIVVAGNGDVVALLEKLDALMRVRAVADDVP